MTIARDKLRIQHVGSNNYPYVEACLTQADSVDGFIIEVEVFATVAGTTTVSAVGMLRDEDNVLLEVAGNTHYSINSAAAASRKFGDFTFDFTTQKVNKVAIKPGTTVGGVAFPAVLPPRFGLLFANTDLKVKSVSISKRINRMEG